MDNYFDLLNFTVDNNNETEIINEDKYDITTLETYRIKRIFKIDPIDDYEIPKNLIFEFKNKWNPYTGCRLDEDEIGPLCFNSLNLFDYFYKNRLNGLWYIPSDNFEGYYGELVGSGTNIQINSRGFYPEKYLFRLPIIDCYLKNNHNYSVVTMGPLLTDEEIEIIDNILLKYGKKRYLTTLKIIKNFYDKALCKNPNPDEIEELQKKFPSYSKKDIIEKYNRINVDKLIQLK